ncbi:PE-PPE domain-containing protein [Allokutzneria sp. A3M-2-11 16]|uniref:PE-PPE domain-containing protein n=1 Tax=Allokutzneria sp. A3M-2-11 16 TaxID=2962043 RepID=UPI0020B6CB4A|nr:PE-PPE domain-containing protein [Allokutzneria sp. A3M-2-11 16]MCP3803064.1 PE-PPE domain-containing protein [Allokutzneria sp. A3M-2-11 16]
MGTQRKDLIKVNKTNRFGGVGLALTALVTTILGATPVSANAKQAEATRYFILIGGTCDGDATVYNDAWLRGGVRRTVHYPAGGTGLPNCNQTPMDASVRQGHEAAKRVVIDSYNADRGGRFVIVGYSQGAIVANHVLNDIADGRLGVDKSRFEAKIYADPMAPVGPPGLGIGAVVPAGVGIPFGGYVSPGPGRRDFGGIPFIRYCIQTDGVCHFNTLEAPGGYFAQHWCYQERPIMADSLADGVYINGSHELGRQNCRPPHPR